METAWLPLLLTAVATINMADKVNGERRCGSIDIRNSPHNIKLDEEGGEATGCQVLEGDFQLSLILGHNHSENDFPQFPNLTEITGFLLVYQVRGLRSLSRMFPRLRVIGGNSLVLNYALIIYQNVDLQELGLSQLVHIRRGGVKVAENARLCHSRFIDWTKIVSTSSMSNILVDDSHEEAVQVAEHCGEGCSPIVDADRCLRSNGLLRRTFIGTHSSGTIGGLHCWDGQHCQISCEHPSGCDQTGARCHDQCIGGCIERDSPSACIACRGVRHEGSCLEKCPSNFFRLLDRRCVTKRQCQSLRLGGVNKAWKAAGGICHFDCPPGYQNDARDPHRCWPCPTGACPRKCKGNRLIDSLGAAMVLKDCQIIEGYLTVDMRMNGRGGEEGEGRQESSELAEALGQIREITGYLVVRFSPSFVSLSMFRSLRLIRGEQLFRDRYALSVFENANLRQLFLVSNNTHGNLTIINGIVQIQNNHMLCYDKIETMLNGLGLNDSTLSELDVSRHSNGDQAVCDEEELHIKALSALSNGFVIEWIPLNLTDLDQRKYLGYQIFYKPIPQPDLTMNRESNRSACADSWTMVFEPNERHGQATGSIISGEHILRNHWYALYVQTRLVHHEGARNAVSKIQFVKTLFDRPDPPRLLRTEMIRSDVIQLAWAPPVEPKGDISHYIVSWTRVADDAVSASQHACADNPGRKRPDLRSLPTQTPIEGQCELVLGCCGNRSGDDSIVRGVKGKKQGNSGTLDASVLEQTQFENAIQNIIFVPDCTRRPNSPSCHGIQPRSSLSRPRPEQIYINETHRMKRSASDIPVDGKQVDDNKNPTQLRMTDKTDPIETVLSINATDSISSNQFLTHSVNISGLNVTLTGLTHFTEYEIKVTLCQDETAPEHYCSMLSAREVVRTLPIAENDMVDNRSVVVIQKDDNEHSRYTIIWDEPEHANGALLGFRVKLINDNQAGSSPQELCIKLNEFRTRGGVIFDSLPGGVYTLEVRSLSLAGLGAPLHMANLFTVTPPTRFTPTVIIAVLGSSLMVLIVSALLIYYWVNRHFGKKVREYLGQVISANPEYLSQLDVYKQDEWELAREDIVLDREIGRGTFGKVYMGNAENVHSECGVVFGPCAVKTVTDTATPAERLHFLIEASVMKQFNTAFIVKLLGVVSDGQPVLVVMELMHNNLRDYLRARRPESEENATGAPIPDEREILSWAAQIADGMAYLESVKFCHRDLAARNCMISVDGVVKIGDFGMARDIYYHEYYKPTGKRLMPVRWMAPESLKDGRFTMKSDVWSYGIVLYEILTLAQQPYAGLSNDEVFQYITVSRKILKQPTECPNFWYQLMEQCWRYDARNRPSFAQLVHFLMSRTSVEFQEISFVLTNKELMNELNKARQQYGGTDLLSVAEARHRKGLQQRQQDLQDEEEEKEEEEQPVCTSNRRGRSKSNEPQLVEKKKKRKTKNGDDIEKNEVL